MGLERGILALLVGLTAQILFDIVYCAAKQKKLTELAIPLVPFLTFGCAVITLL